MRHLATISLFLITLTAFSQSFESLISQGKNLYDSKKYLESAQAFEKAFAVKNGSASDYYNAACSYALAGENENAINYLTKAVDLGWTNVSHLKSDSDLTNLHEESSWDDIV